MLIRKLFGRRSKNPTGKAITTTTGFGRNANLGGATANAIGTENVVFNNPIFSFNIHHVDQQLKETQSDDQNQSMTQLLPRAMAAHDDYMPQKGHVECFEGTREALLKEIENWFKDLKMSQIYVLSGLAGIGKSTIAYTVAKRADRLGLLGGSFFFSRKESERRTAEKFFTTIASQLCAYKVEFAHAIEKVLGTPRGKNAIQKDPETQLNVLIIEPLQDLVRYRTQPVVIVVDALDECDDKDAQVIVEALGHLVNKIPSFKVLLTTRPQPHLDHLFGSHHVFHLHKIEDKIVNDDIRSYLKFQLSMEQVKSILPTLRTPWSATDNDIDTLVEVTGKLFIIASISVLFILDKTVCNPASQMEKLRNELSENHARFIALDDFYPIILNAVVPPGSERALVERFQKVVGAIVLIFNPLPLHLHILSALKETISTGFFITSSLLSCSVMTIFHISTTNRFQNTEKCKDKNHCINSTIGHTWLTICCLQIMNKHLKQNILNIHGVEKFKTNSEILNRKRKKKKMLRKISLVLRYACIYWARHLNGANVDDTGLIDQLTEFANEHWPHWTEVYSWLYEELFDLDGAIKFMKKTRLCDLRQLLSDGIRFLFKFHPLVEVSALSIYRSALPFIPTESLFYKKYKREMMDNICRVQGGPKIWDAVIASNVHGQCIDRIAFDEPTFAFTCCSMACIIIWNGNSGSMKKAIHGNRTALSNNFTLVAHSQNNIAAQMINPPLSIALDYSTPIHSVAFSSNNLRFAVALLNGEVTLLSVLGPTFSAKFDGFGSDSRFMEPYHLLFSPNSDKLAYRLADGGVALRNAIDGEHIVNLNYNSAMVHRLVFSPDGSQLASLVVEDNMHTLTMWNCTDGTLLEAVQDVGSELAFSPDGSFIAAWGWSKTVELWIRNREEGLCFIETPLLTPIENITCLAFSPDGMLAIGSADSGIILYDIANDSITATIPFRTPTAIPFRTPTAIAFSHDCTRLGIGNADGIFRLLDVPIIKASSRQTSQGHSAPVSVLMFSPDCSRIVSGSEDGIIRIWNTSCIDEPIATCKGHSSKITTLAFTPDGNQFACGDATGTIKFWSSDDCALCDTVQWPIFGELTSMALSKDLLAGATSDSDSIALWDRQKSRIINHLGECGSMQLSFSNDDENLLLASFDDDSRSVAVWDVRSCTLCASFSVDNMSEEMDLVGMVFYPDDSKLLVHGHKGDSNSLFSFNLAEQHPNDASFSDLISHGIFPSWKGIPVYMFPDSHYYSIGGWFRQDDGKYTVMTMCQTPEDFEVVKATYGSSMFALLCKNGNLVLLQSNEN